MFGVQHTKCGGIARLSTAQLATNFCHDGEPMILFVDTRKHEFSIMHIDVSRAYIHAEAQGPVLVRLPHEDIGKHDGGKIGRLRKSMHGTRHAASNAI